MISKKIIEKILSAKHSENLDLIIEELGDGFQNNQFDQTDGILIVEFLMIFIFDVEDAVGSVSNPDSRLVIYDIIDGLNDIKTSHTSIT